MLWARQPWPVKGLDPESCREIMLLEARIIDGPDHLAASRRATSLSMLSGHRATAGHPAPGQSAVRSQPSASRRARFELELGRALIHHGRSNPGFPFAGLKLKLRWRRLPRSPSPCPRRLLMKHVPSPVGCQHVLRSQPSAIGRKILLSFMISRSNSARGAEKCEKPVFRRLMWYRCFS
jgi:hypothetical protein